MLFVKERKKERKKENKELTLIKIKVKKIIIIFTYYKYFNGIYKLIT